MEFITSSVHVLRGTAAVQVCTAGVSHSRNHIVLRGVLERQTRRRAAIHENPDVPPASPRAIMTVEKAVWYCPLVGTVRTRGVPRSKAGGAARGTDENRCRLMFL